MGRRTRAWLVTVATATAVALAGTACAGSSASAGGGAGDGGGTVVRANQGLVETDEQPKPGGRLVYGLIAETNGWNPATNQWASSGLQVAHSFFDTLTAFDEESKVHPFFAERIEHDPEFTAWTITLRSGVTFSNGKPVTAEAVARSYNYMKSSPTLANAYYLVTSIEASGANDIVIRTKVPTPQLTSALASQIGVIADPDWLSSNDSLKPVGTGPFALESWEIGNKLIVKKNPTYWRTDPQGTPYPYLDSVEFRVITDQASRAAALKAGDIDVMETISGLQVQDFTKLGDQYQVFASARGESFERFVQLNTQAAPFDDVDARRALAYATDRRQVIDIVSGGYDPVADGPYEPDSPWYHASGYPEFDQAKARELVEKVKARHGGTFSFTMVGSAEPDAQQTQQLLQQQWREVGIDAQLQTLEQAKLIISVVTGGYQATTWRQFDAPNPYIDSIWWNPEVAAAPPAFSLNFARWRNDTVGRSIAELTSTTDPEVFRQAVGVIQEQMGADVPYVWLFHQQVSIIASARPVNLTRYRLPDGAVGLDLVNGSHPLWQVWLR